MFTEKLQCRFAGGVDKKGKIAYNYFTIGGLYAPAYDSLSEYIRQQFPGIKGFNRRGLYRMKQFYDTYAGNEKVSALLTQVSWTNHLLIMSGSKSDEEREFYIQLAVKENYSSRQLERQMDSGYYERYMLSKEKLLPESLRSVQNPFLDSYVVEFLDLPDTFHESAFEPNNWKWKNFKDEERLNGSSRKRSNLTFRW